MYVFFIYVYIYIHTYLRRYYENPYISLPDDQSGNFQNTELAYFLLSDPNLMTKKYELLFDQLYELGVQGNT